MDETRLNEGVQGEASVGHSRHEPRVRFGRVRVEAWVLPQERALLLEMGSGNISEGLRRALLRKTYSRATATARADPDLAAHVVALRPHWTRDRRELTPDHQNLAWITSRRNIPSDQARQVLRALKVSN